MRLIDDSSLDQSVRESVKSSLNKYNRDPDEQRVTMTKIGMHNLDE